MKLRTSNGTTPTGGADSIQPHLPPIGRRDLIPLAIPAYLRPNDATKLLPISRRTLGNWQRNHVLPFYRIGRTVMFKRTDIEAALARFRVAAVGE